MSDLDQYMIKKYGLILDGREVSHQVTCYIGQCSCSLLVSWYKSGLGKTAEGMKYFEDRCECGACN